jgi:hypothetical protein
MAMTVAARVRWLSIASLVTAASGLMIAAAATPALNAPTAFLTELVVGRFDGAPTLDAAIVRLLCAVAGGVLAGWALMVWLVAKLILPIDFALGRRLVLASITTWFIVDSSMSIAAGAPLNVLGNIGFLIAFLPPVLTVPDDAHGSIGHPV